MIKELDTNRLPSQEISEDPAWVRREQLRLLNRNANIIVIGSVFCATALVMLLWPVVTPGRLMLWLAAIGVLSLGRLVLHQRFREIEADLGDPVQWERLFLGSILLSGLGWGAVSIGLFPPDAAHHTYIAFVLAGVSAGAVTVYAYLPNGFLAFALPALGPFIVRLLMTGSSDDRLLAAVVAIFLLLLHRVAMQSGGNVRSLLELQTQNAQLAKALHHQATHDSLVNLINHGEFQRRLHRIMGRGGRAHDISLIFIDLDLFKNVNDSGGHGAGDAVLREVARILRSHTRTRDTAARVGGDEFALLLENCPGDKALEIAEHVRRDVAALEVDYEDKIHRLCASIGVTYGQTGLQSATGMLKAADAACYAAKESGRNRVRMLPADEMLHTTGRFSLAKIVNG